MMIIQSVNVLSVMMAYVDLLFPLQRNQCYIGKKVEICSYSAFLGKISCLCEIIFLSSHLKNSENFKGNMDNVEQIKQQTLQDKILSLPEESVIFRSDYPEYHAEFVGGTLALLTQEGVLKKVAQGIYVKPAMSRFGAVLPSVGTIVRAIAERDHVQVMPTGITALNALGLSTQVPMTYTYLTTGSKRVIKMEGATVSLKTAVPRYFSFETKLIGMLVQALKSLTQEGVDEEHLSQIAKLLAQEPNQEAMKRDILCMPAWMKRIVKPLIK